MSALEGATNAGDPAAYPATPGEFAARWNAWTEERRARVLAALVDASEASGACLREDHRGTIAALEAERAHLAARLAAASGAGGAR